jgi:hypothetical protein
MVNGYDASAPHHTTPHHTTPHHDNTINNTINININEETMSATSVLNLLPRNKKITLYCTPIIHQSKINKCHADWSVSGYYRATDQVGSANSHADSDVTHAYL